MIKTAIHKIYVILGKENKGDLEQLSRTLSGLFSYVNMTSNLYLVAGNLPESMPQVERIQKDVIKFLRENLFARLYLHFVHAIPQTTVKGIDYYFQYYYQYLKRETREFDQEGYVYQEVPRFMLLPVIVPGNRLEPALLITLLDTLKGDFMLPCLYLDRSVFFLAQDKDLMARTEKVYYGNDDSREPAAIACNMFNGDLLNDSLEMLTSEDRFVPGPCQASLIISAQDGKVYTCLDAFRKNQSLTDIYKSNSVDALMTLYYEHGGSKRDCLECRARVPESFADLPISQRRKQRIGALLCHFGTLYHDAGDDIQAVEKYEQSLKLSLVQEAGHINFRLGLGYTNIGRFDQAVKAFNNAELTYQSQYYFHFYKGRCYFEMGDYQAALSEFLQALHLKPQQEDLVKILIYAGSCHNSLGEYEEAAVVLEKAEKASGHVKEIYNALGFSYFQLKNYDKAIEKLLMAVEIDPCSAVDYASLGANYREKGDFDKAIVMYEKALALDPDMILASENLERLKKRI
ncbi:MAG: tetratricopeptide repeat protein [Desulfobacterales bacterium]|uniref:Tetratricopeptide repeat protein n=1 Tax=Candidatus Desulfaltia bathyphila TaxID=2841697 RepID=A0A8J6T7N8_9BACT|nr:tetratricopeptide repeat protein [Candidatus Desulfaltia bathyphila]MBL7196154.1 tetratricopeptide repeat protein [Desulfobacterales bacterium]MBL7208220.1 tetratricopeptide repeat protein [Desulfobacterales bacterium]